MKVILVDIKDNILGTEDKIKAHKEGTLHRAFSIFIFNDKNELLIQRRAAEKYHSPGLWSNTCCSHPSGKNLIEEAKKRLKEEMGFECELEEKFSFIYKAKLEEGLIEHEYDHVFFGKYNKEPFPNPDEVSDWKWVSIDLLKKDIDKNPNIYTPWLRIVIERIEKNIN